MMKRTISVLLLVLMSLTLILPAFPAQASEVAVETNYGEAYNELQTEQQRQAYRLVEEGVAGLSPVVVFLGAVEVHEDELGDILRAVCVDHPEYFWFLESGLMRLENQDDPKQVTAFEPQYILDGKITEIGSQEFIDAVYAFHTKVQQIVEGIPVNYTTEYEVALYLHDYLAENVTYTLEGDHPSAYAALIHGEAACYGYSKAYQCLLKAAGIRARTITGNSDNGDGELIGHAWNQVWLDGACYYVDVTWDDFDSIIVHEYFGMTLEQISADHFADEEFVLQDCTHERINYHELHMGRGVAQITGATSAAEAVSYFRLYSLTQAGAVFVCEIRYTGASFATWLDRTAYEMSKILGLSNAASIRYYYANNVYYVQIVDPSFRGQMPMVNTITLKQNEASIEGSGSSFQVDATVKTDGAWIPNLVYESSDPSVVTVDAEGLVTAISVGTAQIVVRSEDGQVSAVCNITVTQAPEHTHTMRLFLEKSATCSQNGHKDYYLCSGCGLRFGDEAGTVAYVKTEDFVLPIRHLKLFYFSENGEHVKRCKCGVYMEETREPHLDEDKNEICDICELPISGGFAPLENQDESEGKNAKWILPVLIGVAVVGAGAAIVCIVIHRRRWRIG